MSSDESRPKKFELGHIPIYLKAAAAGVQAALTDHKRRQESVVVWKDGQVVEVPPEEIPDYSEPEQTNEGKKDTAPG